MRKQILNVSLTQPCPLPTNCETWCSESDCLPVSASSEQRICASKSSMFRSRSHARCQQTAKRGVLNQIAFPAPRQVNSGFAKQIHNVSLTQQCPLPTNCETWCSESDCRCRLSAYSSPFFFPHPSFSGAARKIHLPPREGISRIRLPLPFSG